MSGVMIFIKIIQKNCKNYWKISKTNTYNYRSKITILENHNNKMRQNEVLETYLYSCLIVGSNNLLDEFICYFWKNEQFRWEI